MINKEHIANAKKPQGELGKETINRMNSNHNELTNWALSFLDKSNVEKILDIGCGGGATIDRLHRKYNNAYICGVDYSKESVEFSREYNCELIDVLCDVKLGDVHNLPYEDKLFDIVTAFETIYFWRDLEKAISEVNRVLKDNGVFLICCEMSDNKNPKWQNVLEEMKIYSSSKWIKIIEENGFRVISERNKQEWICMIFKKA